MRNAKIFITILTLLLFRAGSASYARAEYNEATGEQEIILVPESREIKMGKSIAASVRKQFKPDPDPLVQKRIDDIGQRLAEVSDRDDIQYHFEVIDGDYYNAFALPGGYIFVFKKLYDNFDDDMLAAVLAHEIGHIAAKHSIKKFQGSLGATLLMILGKNMDTDDGSAARGARDAINSMMANYSQQDEMLADKLSVKYVKRAGFDPDGVIRSLEKFQDVRKEGPLYKYHRERSHPYLSVRISRIKEEVTGALDFEDYINIPAKEGVR